jgi:2-oxoglutarate dehydrogenase complex dehydrogenase (E1) component-like enzyme
MLHAALKSLGTKNKFTANELKHDEMQLIYQHTANSKQTQPTHSVAAGIKCVYLTHRCKQVYCKEISFGCDRMEDTTSAEVLLFYGRTL